MSHVVNKEQKLKREEDTQTEIEGVINTKHRSAKVTVCEMVIVITNSTPL